MACQKCGTPLTVSDDYESSSKVRSGLVTQFTCHPCGWTMFRCNECFNDPLYGPCVRRKTGKGRPRTYEFFGTSKQTPYWQLARHIRKYHCAPMSTTAYSTSCMLTDVASPPEFSPDVDFNNDGVADDPSVSQPSLTTQGTIKLQSIPNISEGGFPSLLRYNECNFKSTILQLIYICCTEKIDFSPKDAEKDLSEDMAKAFLLIASLALELKNKESVKSFGDLLEMLKGSMPKQAEAEFVVTIPTEPASIQKHILSKNKYSWKNLLPIPQFHLIENKHACTAEYMD